MLKLPKKRQTVMLLKGVPGFKQSPPLLIKVTGNKALTKKKCEKIVTCENNMRMIFLKGQLNFKELEGCFFDLIF